MRRVTYADWRLPVVGPSGGVVFNYNFSTAGTTDVGYNITSAASEMSFMHYMNLGNPGFHTTSGAVSGCFVSAADTCLNNTGPFINVQQATYWSGMEYAPANGGAWNFNFSLGGQGAADKSNALFAWAVRTDDIASVTHLRVKIDIKPFQENDETRINLAKNKFLRIAILTKGTFDAIQVNSASVRFGPALAAINRYNICDVNDDGNADMVLIFKTADTGIAECDTRATLTGNLYDGTSIEGCDSFVTRKCTKRLLS